MKLRKSMNIEKRLEVIEDGIDTILRVVCKLVDYTQEHDLDLYQEWRKKLEEAQREDSV